MEDLIKQNYRLTNNINNDISLIINKSNKIVYRNINITLIERNWLIGKRIDQEILSSRKEDYGKEIINNLSIFLTNKYGKGFDYRNLYFYLKFYQMFPNILNSLSSKSLLTWTHYRILLQINDEKARKWYENEAKNEMWSVRALQRNISTQYYKRLLSTNSLINNSNTINKSNKLNPLDFIKDPYITEFLKLPLKENIKEKDLEDAVINNLQDFMMELGKGFAFIGRQVRIHTEKENYYIDLVFYNYILKCFVLIDLKIGKLTHQDIGQMDMYLRLFDNFKKMDNDNPTIGIILCSDTDSDLIKYSILNDNDNLYASKYSLYLPTIEELKYQINLIKELYFIKEIKDNDLDK